MLEKTLHVLDQLPEHRHTLRERIMVDREFRSLCEDYGEAFEALRRWEGSTEPQREARVAEFRVLLGELEREIRAALGVT